MLASFGHSFPLGRGCHDARGSAGHVRMVCDPSLEKAVGGKSGTIEEQNLWRLASPSLIGAFFRRSGPAVRKRLEKYDEVEVHPAMGVYGDEAITY